MTEQSTSLFTQEAPPADTQATSLSIEKSLINDTQALAEELEVSWSRLVTLALEEFVRRSHKKKNLTDRINAAYADDEHDGEAVIRQEAMRATQRRLLEGEEW